MFFPFYKIIWKCHIFKSEIFMQDYSNLNLTESAMELLTNMEVADARTKGKQVCVGFRLGTQIAEM